MWNRLIEKMKGKNGRKGFTMTELLAVVAIIAVICAIAIPSALIISRNLKFKQRNDYAKTIFMAAQANLSELRSDGSLDALRTASAGGGKTAAGKSGFPEADAEDWAAEYYYTDSTDTLVYAMVLPANSVESALRDQQVIIEYNPYTGNVYSVFYSEERDDIISQYTGSGLPRDDEAKRKKMLLGYYDGSGLSSNDLTFAKTSAEVEYTNGEEGVVTVKIALPSLFYSSHDDFIAGLDVALTLTGETSGAQIPLDIKTSDATDVDLAVCELDVDGRTVLVSYTLDSLANYSSFANIAAEENAIGRSLTTITDESKFTILPGENLTIEADVTFSGSEAAVLVDPGILTGVNPLFEYMEPSGTEGRYILAVSNGRNLQNLNVISPSIAATVDSVIFSDDIYWNQTVAYYNEKYGSGSDYANASTEAPGRALPYFVPIHNEMLFGTSWFTRDATAVLQDNHDATVVGGVIVANDHADIAGNDKMVVGLNIDGTKYAIPNSGTAYEGEYYVTTGYKDAFGSTVGGDQTVSYNFTGLFAYLNTNISNLNVVNSFVKGLGFGSDADRTVATGSLIGTSGYNTLIADCGAYIVKDPSRLMKDGEAVEGAYDAAAMTPGTYSAGTDQTWYGVSGEGAVGGLVGYTKSHRTASGDLTDDTSELAFTRCFAAVPVSGNMRAGTSRYYGYTNGIGGLVGNAELSNFYNCYASGDVRATGCYVGAGNSWNLITYDGRVSMGAGGFSGTSHGSRYTNCFATGDITGSGSNDGVGGFVGIMCYDEGFNYVVSGVTNRIEQLTVFDSCYAVGQTKVNGKLTENFSGGNAGIYPSNYVGSDNYFYTDYYKMLAPYCKNKFGFNKTIYEAPGYPELSDDHYQGNWGQYRNRDYYFVYKDSYYLNRTQVDETAVTSSTGCASAASYAHLTKLHYNHDSSSAWAESQFGLIEAYTVGNSTYKVEYFQNRNSWNNATYWTGLKNVYMEQLGEGFPSGNWTSATAATTHSYSINGGTYPFAMLSEMEYYGDWPTYPLTGGLAYYEYYNGYDAPFAYLDRENTSTLMNAKELKSLNTYVVSDGYAVVASSPDLTITVEMGGKTYTLTSSNTKTASWNYSGTTVTLYPLTQEILEDAAALVETEGYYVKLDLTISGKDYDVYFNPNTAKSQINPVMTSATTHTNPSRPDSLPGNIEIRTARQLAALSSMSSGWTEDYRYVQMLNIDAEDYTAVNYSSADQTAIKALIKNAGTIGTADVPFLGSYNGSNGSLTQSAIAGYTTNTTTGLGIFGTIGASGSVKNLEIQVDNPDSADAIALGSTKLTSAGIAADVNMGTIENVDLTLSCPVSLTAKTAAGLLVGSSSGTVIDCDVTASKAVTITAETAGGALGMTSGVTADDGSVTNAVVTDNTLTFTGDYQANAINAGGFIGSSADTNVRGVKAELKSDFQIAFTSETVSAGGFAGSVSGGSYTSVAVTLSGTSGSTAVDSMGGIAGTAASAKFAGATVNVSGTLIGDTAAGLLVSAEAVTVDNCTAVITGTISGTAAAAGIAGDVDDSSAFSGTAAVLSGTVTSTGSDSIAAGFAVNFGGTAAGGRVDLSGGHVTGPQAAGFAHTITGQLTDRCTVAGTGAVTGTSKAAGFVMTVTGSGSQVAGARITPAVSQSAKAYWGNKNENLTVTGPSAAGFVMNVAADATVLNCDALCAIAGSGAAPVISGFADTNEGVIRGCMANVTLTGGHAFVRSNTGTVEYCYGWYGDGKANDNTTVAPNETSGTYYSSYFVDINIQEAETDGEETVKSVALFEADGTYSATVPSALATALGRLNTETTIRWYNPGAYRAYPYSNNTSYPYPMLRVHCGDWVKAPQYAYGVVYYEAYEAESADANMDYKFHVVELSDPSDTVDSADEVVTQTAFWKYENDTLFQETASCFNNNGTIAETGYLLFCKTGSDPFGSNLVGAEFTDTTAIRNAINTTAGAERYSVYELNSDDMVELISMGDVVEVLPYFADAIGVTGTYQIRTADQLASISRAAASFVQTHDIIVSGNFNTIGDAAVSADTAIGSGCTYDGNDLSIYAANAANTWISSLGGTVQDLTLTVGALSDELFESIDSSGVISDVTLNVARDMTDTGRIIGTTAGTVTIPTLTTKSIGGKLVESVTGGTVTLDKVTVAATAEVPALFGGISGGTVTGSQIDLGTAVVSGSVFGSVTKKATVSNFTIKAGGVKSSLVDTLSGTLSGLTLDADTADLTSSTGVLVNSITEKSSSITGCAVKVDTITSTATAFGGIAGSAPAGTTISGCSVESVNGITASGSTVGGLVGTSAATVSNCTVTGGTATDGSTVPASVNASAAGSCVGGLIGSNTGSVTDSSAAVTIAATDAALVGGLMGKNNAAITDSTANAAISYTQSAETANAVIGGLVGQMDGGSITGDDKAISVTGSIVLAKETATGANRTYIVGGVIGKDANIADEDSKDEDRTTYENITSAVTVDDAFAGGNAASESVTDPAAVGPVGMFVGYVNWGSFDTCSSTAANSNEAGTGIYQFLGQIELYEETLTTDSTNSVWFSNAAVGTDTSYVSTADGNGALKDLTALPDHLEDFKTFAADKGFTYRENAPTYKGYKADLTTCTFRYGDKTCEQTFSSTNHFFLGSLGSEKGGYQMGPVGKTAKYEEADYVRYKDLYEDDNTQGKKVATDYYVRIDGTYYQVYVEVSKKSSNYTYVLYYTTDGSNYSRIKTWTGRNRDNWISDVTLYTASTTIEFKSDAQYMITNSDGTVALALNGNNVSALAINGETQQITDACLWTVSNGAWRNVGNPDYYLYPNWRGWISTYAQTITVTASGDYYKIKGQDYLEYENPQFKKEQNAQNAGVLGIYEVTQKQDVTTALFDYQQADQSCIGRYLNDKNEYVTLDATVLPTALNESEEEVIAAEETTAAPTEETTSTDETVSGGAEEINQ